MLTSSGGKDVFVARLADGAGAAAQQTSAVAAVYTERRGDRAGRVRQRIGMLHLERVDLAIESLYKDQWPLWPLEELLRAHERELELS
jgi:hypothetical protein